MGLLKLLFHRATRKLLGVHCIGETATEIVHIGQSVMAFDGTIDYFRDTVFNYPTMAECYKVAAFDGLNKLDLDEKYEAEEDLETVVAREPVELPYTMAEAAVWAPVRPRSARTRPGAPGPARRDSSPLCEFTRTPPE